MSDNRKIIPFPDRLTIKKAKYIKIRDEIEKILFSYAVNENDYGLFHLQQEGFLQ